jgi:hypothetical protein
MPIRQQCLPVNHSSTRNDHSLPQLIKFLVVSNGLEQVLRQDILREKLLSSSVVSCWSQDFFAEISQHLS